MNRRISVLLSAGVTCLVLVFLVTSNVSRIQTHYYKWRKERQNAKESAELTAAWHRHFEKAIAGARTEKEKRYATYEYRMVKYAEEHGESASQFQLADGVDEFEALLFAKVYFARTFGMCGYVGMPELKGDDWIVPISVGRKSQSEAPEDPSIIVNSKSGYLSCAGHESVSDPTAYLQYSDKHFY